MADLGKSLLGDKLRDLHDTRRSGVLVVTAAEPNVSKGVFLRGGQIVFASSTLEKDKLGENLIRLGRISRADFASAIQAMQGKKARLGQSLVAAGLLTDEELGRLVAAQVQKIVMSLFTWTSGDMRFHESTDPIPTDLALDLSTHRLLLEGARIFPDVVRLEKTLPPLERKLDVVTHPPFDHTHITFSPAERDTLERCADGATVAELLEGKGSRALRVRAVYALRLGGVITDPHDVHADPDVPDGIESDTGTFRLAITNDEVDATAKPRERILRLYEHMPRATHYEILEVSPQASGIEIQKAFSRLTVEHDREWAPYANDVQLTSIIGTLKLRRRQAHQALSDTERRAAYDRALGAFLPAKAPTVTVEARNQASRLVRQAQELLESGERDGAVSFLLEGVRVDPHDNAARRLLAVTLASHPTLARAAERHFLSALEADPGDVDLRYRLAAYYKKARLPRRAAAECRGILATDPGHRHAGALLRSLERDAGV